MDNISPKGAAALRLFDPRRGDVEFKLAPLCMEDFARPQQSNYFTVLWMQRGAGVAHVDVRRFEFQAPALLFFNPYQVIFLEARRPAEGWQLHFHANFFCIETHHDAVGCNGVLFNDIYGIPLVRATESERAEFDDLISKMTTELESRGLAQPEMLVAYLKIFLIKATRLKLAAQDSGALTPGPVPRPELSQLAHLIETHYRTHRTPREYAALLHLTPKTLGKLVKAHWGRTLTQVIRDRLLKHAKWQLLHTRRSVKEIAWETGFSDEFYFSRVFKRETGLAPTTFREFETAIRSGSNLSMD